MGPSPRFRFNCHLQQQQHPPLALTPSPSPPSPPSLASLVALPLCSGFFCPIAFAFAFVFVLVSWVRVAQTPLFTTMAVSFRSFATAFLSLLFLVCVRFHVVVADQPLYKELDWYNRQKLGKFPNQTFHSTDIVAPLFQVNTFEEDLVDDSGYIFLTVNFNGKGGPAVFSSKDLSLVYADVNYDASFDARAQVKGGDQYLTFFEGGDCHVFDESYRLKWTVTAKGLGSTKADLHEFQFTNQGTALMSVYQDVKFNMTDVGGPVDGMLSDGVFQEVELDTNRVIYVWRASNHFRLTDSYVKYDPNRTFGGGEGFDWFHINSIYKHKDGNFLISSRAFSMIALIDSVSGDPIWILGGKLNQFRDLSGGNATNFQDQHMPRFVHGNESQLSFFDNHGLNSGPCALENCSRGMIVELDYKARTVKLLDEFYHPQHVASAAEGGMARLNNGNFLIGWGYNPAFTEHLPNGTVVMDVQRGALPFVAGANLDSAMTVYRAWKMEWVGRPWWGPDIASLSSGNTTANATVYVSWNGNTDIAEWEVYGGNDKDNITTHHKLIGKSSRQGFETAIILNEKDVPPYAKAFALTRQGDIQGFTRSIDLVSGKLSGEGSSIWNTTRQQSNPDEYPDPKGDAHDKEDGSGRHDDVNWLTKATWDCQTLMLPPSSPRLIDLINLGIIIPVARLIAHASPSSQLIEHIGAMMRPLIQTPFVCRRCVQASRRNIALKQAASYSSQQNKPQNGFDNDTEIPTAKDAVVTATPKKEPGSMARRLEEATEEALFTGGRAGRRAVEDAGFSDELKERLLNKVANADFQRKFSSEITEARLSSAAGQGTRDIATAQAWAGEEATADTVLRMLDDAKRQLRPGLRGTYQPPPVDLRFKPKARTTPGQKAADAKEKASVYTGLGIKLQAGLTDQEKEARRKEFRERFQPTARAMPDTLSGLAALANERIEDAIARGQFRNIPRGTSVERDARADNPFIDTTEYIMNKMIQRQDIVPPWIEKQQELVKAAGVFRGRLRNDWKRHAARMISSRGGSLQEQIGRAEAYAAAEKVHNPRSRAVDLMAVPATSTDDPIMVKMREQVAEASDVATETTAQPELGTPLPAPYRDAEWEKLERSYMELSVQNLNSIARSYNLMAPDLAKKPYFSLDRELRNCFADVAPLLAGEIRARAIGSRSSGLKGVTPPRTAGLLNQFGGAGDVRVHLEADEKAYGMKEWWRDLWKKG
ncbi:hypothetical protein G7046_g6884 [Stylonectria norvegica]|nr:hypothetical protein G7046_g6884 [Stylonectria norvegica]